ncbi:MAG: hypothetical protein ACREIV_00345, partial [Planctomycetaceae bacterium]
MDDRFTPDRPPEIADQYGQMVEKFDRRVTWTRRYRIEHDADPDAIAVAGTLTGVFCSTGKDGLCIPIRPPREFHADLTLVEAPAAKVLPFEVTTTPTRKLGSKEVPDPATFTFRLSPENAQPGERVTLSITADLEGNWHTFALDQNPEHTGLPTRIKLTRIQNLKPLSDDFQPSTPPDLAEDPDGREQRLHHGEITWTRGFEVPPQTDPGEYGVSGTIVYQLCDQSCL